MKVALQILWPAFLVAGALEGLLFVVVEPAQLRWFGADALGWPPQAVYTATFFIFWAAIATSGALTHLLQSD
jgi:hypothetical protein